ncbi:uncharacterized protein LOC106094993 [Stomoxys calcitrans]|uniref:uncharacterized protein LOC106094993 n=1 Tax=Stomoxys calcitrans TaxID=35570 RepID=UPI0027E2A5F9|nr:uncharacterized protein LOC106094993 [Stomoxys calcitrans]
MRYEYDANLITMSLNLNDCNGRMKLNGTLVFLKDLKDFSIINWLVINRSNGKRSTLYNITVKDGCQYLENSFGKISPIFLAVLQNVRKFVPDLPNKCPFRKNRLITVRDFHYDEDMFPPYLPEVNFSCVLGMQSKRSYIFKIFLTGHSANNSSASVHRRKI